MVLVDTSVLVDYFRNMQNAAVRKFDEILDRKIPFGITPLVYQELLKGVSSAKEFDVLKRYLDTHVFYELTQGKESYAEAARIYFRCRRGGVTVRSSIDCLICQTAIEHHLLLLHNDQDFVQMAKVVKNLRFF